LGEELTLPVPGEVRLANNWSIRSSRTASGGNLHGDGFFQASRGVGLLELVIQLDASKLTLPLSSRVKPGERWRLWAWMVTP
jgi:hypothetical protein